METEKTCLHDWDRTWRIIGNFVYCATCGRAHPFNRAYLPFPHADACPLQYAEQYPWLELDAIWRSIISNPNQSKFFDVDIGKHSAMSIFEPEDGNLQSGQ